MPKLSLYQRAFWVAIIAAATPYAFFRLTRKPMVPLNEAPTFNEADLYDNLFDGELAAAG